MLILWLGWLGFNAGSTGGVVAASLVSRLETLAGGLTATPAPRAAPAPAPVTAEATA